MFSVPGIEPVNGVTAMDGQLYVIRAYSNKIEVYDDITHRRVGYRWLQQLIAVVDMASCTRNHCLYVADRGNVGSVHRVDVATGGVESWTTDGIPCSMSVTSAEGHVLVAFEDAGHFKLFTTHGKPVRQVDIGALSPDRHVLRACHAVQLTPDQFIVLCRSLNDNIYYVCLLSDDNQHLVSKYGGLSQFDRLTHVAVDPATGNIYIADGFRQRVAVLNSNFTLIDSIASPDQETRGPRTLFVDANKRLLHVAETGGHVMTYRLRA